MTRQPANNDSVKRDFRARKIQELWEKQPPDKQEAVWNLMTDFSAFSEDLSGKAVYTPEEAAKKLKVTLRTIGEWLRRGKLKGVKIAHTWRIPKAELDRYLNPSTEK